MREIHGGRTNYGELVGIIMLDTVFPRLPGDIGNASTFPFPVRYQYVKGAFPERVVKGADRRLLEPFLAAARELEAAGVRAITTSCGFLAVFQRELAAAVSVPVFTSSLLQVPLIHQLLRPDQKVGIITAHGPSLTRAHLEGVGALGIPHVIRGMPEEGEFSHTYVQNKPTLNRGRAEEELVAVARELVREEPTVGALLLECTNMPPFARAVQEATGLPVFDIVTLVYWIYRAVLRADFQGFM